MLKDEIKAKLTEAGVPFDEDMKKDELLQLLNDSNIEDTNPNASSEEAAKKKYIVVHDFKDLKDNDIIYIKGDTYPKRSDAIVSEERIKELSSANNKIGRVLIEEQE